MKKFLLIVFLAMVLGAGLGYYVTCQAAPFLVSDPPTDGADYYVITSLTGLDTSNVPKDPTGQYGVKVDLATLAPGTYSILAKACYSIWGVCSAEVPFEFTKPSTSTIPAGLRLSR
jgi:hypothetical protein